MKKYLVIVYGFLLAWFFLAPCFAVEPQGQSSTNVLKSQEQDNFMKGCEKSIKLSKNFKELVIRTQTKGPGFVKKLNPDGTITILYPGDKGYALPPAPKNEDKKSQTGQPQEPKKSFLDIIKQGETALKKAVTEIKEEVKPDKKPKSAQDELRERMEQRNKAIAGEKEKITDPYLLQNETEDWEDDEIQAADKAMEKYKQQYPNALIADIKLARSRAVKEFNGQAEIARAAEAKAEEKRIADKKLADELREATYQLHKDEIDQKIKDARRADIGNKLNKETLKNKFIDEFIAQDKQKNIDVIKLQKDAADLAARQKQEALDAEEKKREEQKPQSPAVKTEGGFNTGMLEKAKLKDATPGVTDDEEEWL